MNRSDLEPEAVATLYYHHAGPEQLMADLEKLVRGVPAGGIVRVFTPLPETWEQMRAWCAVRNYGIVRRTDEYADWAGRPNHMQFWDIVDIEVG
jgi:hypothetical protein